MKDKIKEKKFLKQKLILNKNLIFVSELVVILPPKKVVKTKN
jgi:hypothetical protein